MRLMKVQWWAVLALVFALSGCAGGSGDKDQTPAEPSSRWSASSTRIEMAPTGHLIEPAPAAEIGFRLGWANAVELLQGQEIISVTALGDLVITIESPKNVVTAMRVSDGQTIWKIDLGSDLETLFPPTRIDKNLYVHSASRMFTVNSSNGEVTAVANLETSVSATGVLAPETGLIILSGTNGRIFAHSTRSNFSRWRYDLSNSVTSSPVVAGRDVFVVDTGGTYAMLEANSGLPLWRNRALGPVNTQAKVLGSDVILASQDGKLYALNRSTGRDTWKYLDAEQPLTADPVALGRLIMLPLLPNPGFIAIDSINGEEIWRADITASPVITRQRDLLLHSDNSLLSIDLDDGEKGAEVSTLPLQTVEPVGSDGAIILVSPNGRLLKLSPL